MKSLILLFTFLILSFYSNAQLVAGNNHFQDANTKWNKMANQMSNNSSWTTDDLGYYHRRINSILGDLNESIKATEQAIKKCEQGFEILRDCEWLATEDKEEYENRWKYIYSRLSQLDSKYDRINEALGEADARLLAGYNSGVSSKYWQVASSEASQYLIDANDSFFQLAKYFYALMNDETYLIDLDKFIEVETKLCNAEPAKEETELELTIRLANEGNPNAQYNLGVMYWKGDPLNQDYEKSEYWMTKSAEQGLRDACYWLGLSYKKGDSVEQDRDKAIYWFEQIANKGDLEAQYVLGVMYYWGSLENEYKDVDTEKAKYWLQKVQDQGSDKADTMLLTLGE